MQRRDAEDGYALITVIGLMGVLTIIAVVALTYVMNATPQARQHQDWNASLAAAEAGVDDYLARLNRDQFYWRNADPDTNPALEGWANLPDSDGSFHYTFDPDDIQSTGEIRLTSTGTVNGATRTIETRVARDSFLRYLYFTQWETFPQFDIATEDDDGCDAPYGDRDAGCLSIFFVSQDDINGPLHTNDQMALSGSPNFFGTVTSGFGGTDTYRGTTSGPLSEIFRENNPPEPIRRDPLGMPASNRELASFATEEAGGCLYYGPTFIELRDDEMRVRSPFSHLPPAGGEPTPSYCRNGSAQSGVDDTGWIDVPPNGVIYVADQDRTTYSGEPHPLGLPRAGQRVTEYTAPTSADREDQYQSWRGDAFVWGSFDRPLTIGSQADLYPVWDLVASEDEALLGLIANRFVRVWHPVTTGGDNMDVIGHAPFPSWSTPALRPGGVRTFRDARLDAAIFAVRRSFVVDHFRDGAPLGTLEVNGAIAQRFRGPVGTFSGSTVVSGYDKDYTYNNRLLYISPPYFIDPVSSSFGVTSWAELRRPSDLPPLP